MIVIPDIHGRTFWKSAVKGNENEDIIFLGDYMDPYSKEEGISYEEAIENFIELISFANSHKNVTLLLGNHDCPYINPSIFADNGRHDYFHYPEIKAVFNSFERPYLLAAERIINGKRYIFSHAGISKKWLNSHPLLFYDIDWDKINIVDWINNAWEVEDSGFIYALNDVSPKRNGADDAGSMIWADCSEYFTKNFGEDLIGDYQVFGHTMLNYPLITDKFACLDVKRAFTISTVFSRGEQALITEQDGTPAITFEELKKKFNGK